MRLICPGDRYRQSYTTLSGILLGVEHTQTCCNELSLGLHSKGRFPPIPDSAVIGKARTSSTTASGSGNRLPI